MLPVHLLLFVFVSICRSEEFYYCPDGTTYSFDSRGCILTENFYPERFVQANLESHTHKQLCPDGKRVCLNEEVCCKESDELWSCCSPPKVVCCEDAKLCCPLGFTCDSIRQKCVKNSSDPAKGSCVSSEFECPNNMTCCESANNMPACCPFEAGVCCPDMIHCCPQHTKCDSALKKCIKKTDSMDTLYKPVALNPASHILPGACPRGLLSCPTGTCCKDVFGSDACCPYPNGICCSHGYCCPNGTHCDDSTGTCSSSMLSFQSRPFIFTETTTSSKIKNSTRDILCPDKQSICSESHSCCLLIDNSFGCCPLENGTCCADHLHCCPSGTTCIDDGTCVRQLVHVNDKPIEVKSERMVPTLNPFIKMVHLLQANHETGDVVHAIFCGGCAHDWLCCPDANGTPNQMCCPEPGSVCCPDGKHCCPRDSVCLPDGRCVSNNHDTQKSLAELLSRAKNSPRKWDPLKPEFVDFPAVAAKSATFDVLLLLDDHYNENTNRYTVCPDRERYCQLNEQCAVSNQYGYVCIPVQTVSCYPESDTWCPADAQCRKKRTCRRFFAPG